MALGPRDCAVNGVVLHARIFLASLYVIRNLRSQGCQAACQSEFEAEALAAVGMRSWIVAIRSLGSQVRMAKLHSPHLSPDSAKSSSVPRSRSACGFFMAGVLSQAFRLGLNARADV